MRTHLFLLIVAALAGTHGKATHSKNGDGIVIDSEYKNNNENFQQKEILISRLASNNLKDDDCENGERKPSTESCRKYYECENNKYVEYNCFFFRKFDSETLSCTFRGAKCAEADPVTKQTEPVTKPTDPVTKPTEPVTKPTDPVTKPTDPVTKPTDHVTNSTEPNTTENDDQTTPTSSAGHQLPPFIIVTLLTYLHTTFFSRL